MRVAIFGLFAFFFLTAGYYGAPSVVTGTATNDSAGAGQVGEYISSSQQVYQNISSSNTWINCTSISLTPGDWDVTGRGLYNLNAATVTSAEFALSANSANTTTDHVYPDNVHAREWASGFHTGEVANWRVSIAATATYYAKCAATKSAGTPQCKCHISARRVR